MNNKMGRPPLFKTPMVSRTFRISTYQDKILDVLAHKKNISKNAVVRELIMTEKRSKKLPPDSRRREDLMHQGSDTSNPFSKL